MTDSPTPQPPKTPMTKEQIERAKQIMQDFGLAKDSQRLALLTRIFNPDSKERLTIIKTREVMVHLNYLKHIAEILGPERGKFIQSLYDNEIDLSASDKGVNLEKLSQILQQQNANEITVNNKTIPQMIAEPKKGILARLGGKDNAND